MTNQGNNIDMAGNEEDEVFFSACPFTYSDFFYSVFVPFEICILSLFCCIV